jgi:hypothetical protein
MFPLNKSRFHHNRHEKSKAHVFEITVKAPEHRNEYNRGNEMGTISNREIMSPTV